MVRAGSRLRRSAKFSRRVERLRRGAILAFLAGLGWGHLPFAGNQIAGANQETSAAQSGPQAEWTMLGGTPARNMVSPETGLRLDFDLTKGTNVAWAVPLGNTTYGVPVMAGGKILIGTNNGGERLPHVKGDKGIVLCLDQASGELVWQLTRDKLPSGAANDWDEQGICSTPVIEGDRAWLVTNRCELICVDLNGFADGENDGAVTDEPLAGPQDADVVWCLDMIGQLDVYPHNLSTSSPLIHGDTVFLLTSNGVDVDGEMVLSPEAPSFLAVNKLDGTVLWAKNYPGEGILDGQWASPATGEINGEVQVCFPGGDGWLYALRPDNGEVIWKFDCNPKAAVWGGGGTGDRNYLVSTPVYFEDSVLIGVGQDPENGDGVGCLYRIDATKTGDISPELGPNGAAGAPNPDSGLVWKYGGLDSDGSITGKAGEPVFRRTLSTCSVGDGLVFVCDVSGMLHCVDLQSGKRCWTHDMMSTVWGSTLLADGKVFVGNQDGKLMVFAAKREAAEVLAEFDTDRYSSVYSSPVIVDGSLYLADLRRLYRVRLK